MMVQEEGALWVFLLGSLIRFIFLLWYLKGLKPSKGQASLAVINASGVGPPPVLQLPFLQEAEPQGRQRRERTG